MWKRYIDDTFEIVKRTERDNLTTHLNSMDKSGSIRFTDEPEVNGSIPFLDALIKRNEDGTLKVMVYRKKIPTDQYLNLRPITRSNTNSASPGRSTTALIMLSPNRKTW